jgi:hypothetical protein
MGFLKKWFKREVVAEKQTPIEQYAYCETVTATAISKWHIRKLTEVGKKLSGGADTPALCGRKVCWDRALDIIDSDKDFVCEKCFKEYLSRKVK